MKTCKKVAKKVLSTYFRLYPLVEKGDGLKKRLVVIPISTNLSTIGQKPTPVRPKISIE